MNRLSTTCLALAIAAAAPPVIADRADAFCEVRDDGATAASATGYCTVWMDQDRIGIRLANGEAYELAPGERAGRFRDRNGNAVDHEVRDDGSHRYGWARKTITVYFDRAEGIYH